MRQMFGRQRDEEKTKASNHYLAQCLALGGSNCRARSRVYELRAVLLVAVVVTVAAAVVDGFGLLVATISSSRWSEALTV